MKKMVLIFLMGIVFVSTNVFAAGDLVVNGQLGIGKSPGANAKVDVSVTTETFGINVLSERDTTLPVMGASYYVYLDGTSDTYANEAGGFSNSMIYRRQTDSSSSSILYAGHNQALIGITNGSGYTVDNISGIYLTNGMHSDYNATATLTNGYGIVSSGLNKNGSGTLTVSDFRHIYLMDRGDQFGSSTLSVTNQTGLWIDKQELGNTINYGLVLNGDGAGADIVFGPTQQQRIYSDTGRLYAQDSFGNQTILSPHDPETGEWIYFSKNIKTGKVVRVDMEKLVKAVEKLTGETFMVESIMEK